jgi:hypothetical protein
LLIKAFQNVVFLNVGGLTLTNQYHMKEELRADLSESALFFLSAV